jgi:hypothetical protein
LGRTNHLTVASDDSSVPPTASTVGHSPNPGIPLVFFDYGAAPGWTHR